MKETEIPAIGKRGIIFFNYREAGVDTVIDGVFFRIIDPVSKSFVDYEIFANELSVEITDKFLSLYPENLILDFDSKVLGIS